jgi:flagellar M-ring protein FliF
VIYGKKGTKLSNQTDVETLDGKGGTAQTPATTGTTANVGVAGATTSAGGTSKYSHTKGDTTFGVDKTVESKVVVPGAVQRLSIALVVDKSVPASEVASLQSSVAALAGIDRKRGDTISLSRVKFGKQEETAPVKPGPLDALGGPAGVGKWVLLVLGALAFLFFVRRGLKRREGEAIGVEPTWLREITESRPLAELEAGRAAIDLSTDARRQHVTEQVEEIVRRQPETIANQVTQWMRE